MQISINLQRLNQINKLYFTLVIYKKDSITQNKIIEQVFMLIIFVALSIILFKKTTRKLYSNSQLLVYNILAHYQQFSLIIQMNSKTQLAIQQTTFHTQIRKQKNHKNLTNQREKLYKSITNIIFKQAFANFQQQSIDQLTSHLKEFTAQLELSEIEAQTIVSILKGMQHIPYYFLIELFQKLSQSSQSDLMNLGLDQVAVFVDTCKLIAFPNAFALYLLFISKIKRPIIPIKQYFFCCKIIPSIFLNKLQGCIQNQMCLAFDVMTKEKKFNFQFKDSQNQFTNSLRYMIQFIQNATSGLSCILETFTDVAKYKNLFILSAFLEFRLLQRCQNLFDKQIGNSQKQKLCLLILKIYQIYSNNQNIKNQEAQSLLQHFRKLLSSILIFVNSGKASSRCKLQVYFILSNLISVPKYQGIVLSKQIFLFICFRLSVEVNQSSKALFQVLSCIDCFLVLIQNQNILEQILQSKLVVQLFQVSCNIKCGDSIKIVIFYILKQLLRHKRLLLQFSRIPNLLGRLESIKNSTLQTTLLHKIGLVEDLLHEQQN